MCCPTTTKHSKSSVAGHDTQGFAAKAPFTSLAFALKAWRHVAHSGGGAMRNGVPYGLKFISRFFLEIVPPVLAAVIGGFLFAHYYAGSPGPEQSTISAVSAVPADGRAAMVDEEHAQLVDFLRHGREAAKPGDAATGPA